MQDLSITVYHIIRKQRADGVPITTETLNRHIEFFYEELESNWYNPPETRFNLTRVPARECTAEDFGTSANGKKIFDSWAGFYLVCPDISETKKLGLKGDISSMISTGYKFRVEYCDFRNSSKNCASENEIRDFVSDIQLDTWIAHEKMDFLDYVQKPTFFVTSLVSSSLLDYDSNVIPNDYMTVVQNYIETEDEYLQFGYYTYTGFFYDLGERVSRPRRKIVDPMALYQC